jgi:hypothetical protein
MRTAVSIGSLMLSSALLAAQPNDNGSTGEYQVHVGLPDSVQTLEVEFDPSDATLAGMWPNTGWVNALGFEMRGRNSDLNFATSTNAGSMWCLTGSADRFADVRLNVPHNARITFFRMWGFDGSASHDITSFLWESCLPNLSAGTPVNTILGQLASSGNPGSFTETLGLPSPPVTDTRNCTYWARAAFANSCADGGVLILRKFRIQYTLEP